MTTKHIPRPRDEPENLKSELTPAGLRAWGRALVKTGTEHLDLAMVRQGKQALKEAEAAPPSSDT